MSYLGHALLMSHAFIDESVGLLGDEVVPLVSSQVVNDVFQFLLQSSLTFLFRQLVEDSVSLLVRASSEVHKYGCPKDAVSHNTMSITNYY